jgi:hypothetical protein
VGKRDEPSALKFGRLFHDEVQSEWDRVQKYSEQIWIYIDSELVKGMDVSPGIILLGLPENPQRITLVEQLFDEEGIPVSWQDESIEEARARHVRAS